MKKMEVKQMEAITGGNEFWKGVGCGLGIIAGAGMAGPWGALGGVAVCMML
jgi:hypothetical protein